ncbi:MAG: acetate kinase [Eggerthellaceae bacterium]|nr:acetate kinase [Eggerthellaceae bacterium]
MNILIINAGSSSLKYQLMNPQDNSVLSKGLVERVGTDEAFVTHENGDNEVTIAKPMKNHEEALAIVFDALVSTEGAAISSLDEVDAIGHRIVHGGDYFKSSVRIDSEVIEKIQDLCTLAPLHNPPALLCIEACTNLLPHVAQVAVFDTSFFQTLEPAAYTYPIPYELAQKHRIRKYGAHGTSHRYVSQKCAEALNKDIKDLRIITCHLGSGCSVSAVKGGKAVDTSMGFTPLDGIMMGTRSGAIDPAIALFLQKAEGLHADELSTLLNKESGFAGVSGVGNDLRDVESAAQNGNERAQLSLDMFALSVRKYIGQYMVEMGGVDALVFTAGVGENSDLVRSMVCKDLYDLGIDLDETRNEGRAKGNIMHVSSDNSKVDILVIPTNEEAMIAADTYELVK